VCSGHGDGETELVALLLEILQFLREILFNLSRCLTDAGIDLYGRLQEFLLYPVVPFVQFQDLGSAADQVACFGIENLDLKLDSESRFW